MNAPDGMEVDHINHDTLDNRKANLRLCTKAQNQHNQKPRSGCASRFKGVRWSKKNKNWVARIVINGKDIYLGHFDAEEDAARAYDRAAQEFFGEYACLNLERSSEC